MTMYLSVSFERNLNPFEVKVFMNITHLGELPVIDSPCGALKELFESDALSIAHVVVSSLSKKHFHKKSEEIYYITKGEGFVVFDDKELEVKEGDTITLPRQTPHALRPKKGSFELLAISSPKWVPEDEFEVEE